jgi:hypothetical protein
MIHGLGARRERHLTPLPFITPSQALFWGRFSRVWALRLLDPELVAIHQFAIERFHRGLGLARFGYFNEAKTLGNACFFIQHQVTGLDMAKFSEEGPKPGFGGRTCKVAY